MRKEFDVKTRYEIDAAHAECLHVTRASERCCETKAVQIQEKSHMIKEIITSTTERTFE